MTPVFLFLIVLSLTAIPPGATDDGVETDDSFSISKIIERANTDTRLWHGDIKQKLGRNADPCTTRGCKWPKFGSYVRVPVSISSAYTRKERNIIIRALLTFHRSTCIRFYWRRWWQQHYLHFFSGSGCWSYLGRQRGKQNVSLKKNGCLYTGTVQHEVLHALGFHHEHVRSDRDRFVSIHTDNIQTGRESNFVRRPTNNLGTPYDFNSVMHYSNFAFSKNGKPTIIAKSDPDLSFGRAKQMSANDIARVNKLYRCRV
ncbi:hatching enzyme 1.2-like isoform 2-T2 [Symphorus nematophorus]